MIPTIEFRSAVAVAIKLLSLSALPTCASSRLHHTLYKAGRGYLDSFGVRCSSSQLAAIARDRWLVTTGTVILSSVPADAMLHAAGADKSGLARARPHGDSGGHLRGPPTTRGNYKRDHERAKKGRAGIGISQVAGTGARRNHVSRPMDMVSVSSETEQAADHMIGKMINCSYVSTV